MRTRSVPAMLVALITLATLPLAGAGQSMDLWAGAWALNVEKSKYNAGPPPDPKFANATVVLSIVDGQLRITSGPENARWVNVVRFDGKEHRIMGPAQPTTRVYTWIDDRTYESGPARAREGHHHDTARALARRQDAHADDDRRR